MARIKPVIQGVWVKKDYMDKIFKTSSPAAAADLASGITSMYFDTSKIVGDSLIADAVFNNHEGGNIIVYAKPAKIPHSLLLSEDNMRYRISSLEYQVTTSDTFLTIYHTDQGKTTAVRYIKALQQQPHNQLDAGMNYLINKNLIAGNYIATDSAGRQTLVSFTTNGLVKGFVPYHTYYLKNDIGGEPLNNLDEIIFDLNASEDKRKSFAYQIQGDTLTLFSSYANDDMTVSIIGKPLYRLIKRRNQVVTVN